MENTNTVETTAVVEMKKIDGLTETGRVKVAVREALKKQVQDKFFADWETENDGSLSLALVQDRNGTPIKVRVQLTITAQEEFAVKGSKKKEVEEVEIPTLF